MSDSRQIVALNIGSSRLTMGVFARAGKKLTLSRYATRNLEIDPSSTAPRLNQIGAAVADLVGELGLKKGHSLNYSISGQDVFIRFIKLPPITNADVEQLVKFEAQQQIPFPIDEIIWDYHLLPSNGGEQEVVLVAIKADSLNPMNDVFMGLGFTTGKVDTAATALYNAYKDSYPDEQDPVMIIDIGAKTTDIIYSEAGKFFTRSVSSAGVFVTSAIARDLGIGFADAEQLKLAKGMVSMTNGQTEGMEADVAALATSIRNAMTRVASEIQRTTNHYRAQIHGGAPVKAYLCGGGASLPYTKEFLEERLGIPISFFNPIHNVGVGSQINVDTVAREALMLGGIVGCALGAVGRGVIDIDLEPTVVGKIREARKKYPKVLMGVIIAIIGAGAFAYVAHTGLKRAEQEFKGIGSVADTAEGIQRRIAQDENKIRQMDNQLEQYGYMSLQRYGYTDLLRNFVQAAQSDAYWVVDFDPLINYDIASDSPVNSGVSVIKDTFVSDKATSLVTELPDTTGQAQQGRLDEPKGVVVNAIRLKGYVRNSEGGEKIVQEIKDRIAQQGDESLFTFKTPEGVELEARHVLVLGGEARRPSGNTAAADGTPFATSFTLILPLKTPLPVMPPSSN